MEKTGYRDALEMLRDMITRIETGTKEPSIVLLKAIAAALGVTAGELIDEG